MCTVWWWIHFQILRKAFKLFSCRSLFIELNALIYTRNHTGKRLEISESYMVFVHYPKHQYMISTDVSTVFVLHRNITLNYTHDTPRPIFQYHTGFWQALRCAGTCVKSEVKYFFSSCVNLKGFGHYH